MFVVYFRQHEFHQNMLLSEHIIYTLLGDMLLWTGGLILYHFKVLKLWVRNPFFSNLSGIKDDVGSKSIDEMNPSTKEEFVELSQLIVGKLSNYEVTIVHCEVK